MLRRQLQAERTIHPSRHHARPSAAVTTQRQQAGSAAARNSWCSPPPARRQEQARQHQRGSRPALPWPAGPTRHDGRRGDREHHPHGERHAPGSRTAHAHPQQTPSRSGRPAARRTGGSEAAAGRPRADAPSSSALPWLANPDAPAREDEDGDNVSRPTRRRTGPSSTTEGRSAKARRRPGRARQSPGTEQYRQGVRGHGLRPHPPRGCPL